jgi:hypothetical protein
MRHEVDGAEAARSPLESAVGQRTPFAVIDIVDGEAGATEFGGHGATEIVERLLPGTGGSEGATAGGDPGRNGQWMEAGGFRAVACYPADVIHNPA